MRNYVLRPGWNRAAGGLAAAAAMFAAGLLLAACSQRTITGQPTQTDAATGFEFGNERDMAEVRMSRDPDDGRPGFADR